MSSIPGFAFMHGEDWGHAINKVAVRFPSLKMGTPEFAGMVESTFDNERKKYERKEFYRRYREATGNAENICCQLPSSYGAFRALLQSMVIQAWGAFEVMAEDLWRRVVKQRPRLDTRTKDEKRWSGHRSRSKIAKLYSFTFRVDNKAIMRAVDGHRVHALGIVRNVLVHSGGVIDKTFADDRKPFSPKGEKQRGGKYLKWVRGRRVGYKIPFTGTIVRGLIDPVTPLGFDLVRAVDQWLITHR